jgi:hypothetical protein
MTKKKQKAKVAKVRVTKVVKLEEEKHLVAAELEVHGPTEVIPTDWPEAEITEKDKSFWSFLKSIW